MDPDVHSLPGQNKRNIKNDLVQSLADGETEAGGGGGGEFAAELWV